MAIKIILALLCLAVLSSSLKLTENHEGNQAWYTFDEGPTKNRCNNSNQCDGRRKCSSWGWCQGTSRPAKNANYYYNEAITGNRCPSSSRDPNWRNRAYYCDGNRYCSSAGWCHGKSR